MNRKCSVLLYTMMIGFLIIVLALALAPATSSFISTAMNQSTGLDCTNSSISNYDKATCVVVDLNLFYFIGALIFIGGVIVTARIMFGGE